MIKITVNENTFNFDLVRVKEFSEAVIDNEKVAGKDFELHLVFVDAKEMRSINNKYRSEDAVTDVISLPLYSSKKEMEEELSGMILLGDLFVCKDYIYDYCEQNKLYYDEQLKKTIAHGILHLFGYKHDAEKEEKEMNELQNKYAQKMTKITE